VHGYTYSIIADVDECIIGSHSCEPTQLCENTEGSYTCLDDDTNEAVDFDEHDDVIEYNDDTEMSPLNDVTPTQELRTTVSQQVVDSTVTRPWPGIKTTQEVPQLRSTSTAQPDSRPGRASGYRATTSVSGLVVRKTCAPGYVYTDATGNCTGWI